jgi:hypothetical protein
MKSIWIFSVLPLLLSFVMIFFHTQWRENTSSETLINIVALTQVVTPSLSMDYFESKELCNINSISSTYPEMDTLTRMDYVYAK